MYDTCTTTMFSRISISDEAMERGGDLGGTARFRMHGRFVNNPT